MGLIALFSIEEYQWHVSLNIGLPTGWSPDRYLALGRFGAVYANDRLPRCSQSMVATVAGEQTQTIKLDSS